MNRFLSCVLLSAVLLLAGCGGDDGPATPAGQPTPNLLFTAVKQSVPAFEPSTAAAKAMLPDQALRVAYQLLRDYTYPDDEGVVDMSNLYKVLWEASMRLDEAPAHCAAVTPAADTDLTPFAFDDLLGHTYALGLSEEEGGYGSSIAYAQTGNERRMLSSYKWAPDAAQQVAIGVIQAAHDTISGDVSIRFAQAVRYPPGSTMGGAEGSGFAIRARIDGNSTTHAFELKMAVNGTSLVGKGVSQGAGNWFLFRHGDAYYCIPADADEYELMTTVATDLASVPIGGAAYKDAVSAMQAYDLDTDLPAIDLSDFGGGVAGTPVAYLMF
ncbi:MAG: hypothetical protein IPK64_02625 [bacterium]|nr:hypothetical protein [bacterium]